MNKKIYTLTLLLHALYTLAAAGEPYCNDNETVYDFKPVYKTRTITVKPTGFLKVLKKPKTYTEEYVEQERYIKHWKLVPKCCAGYQMSTLRMCEPYCPKGCPKYASCVEPNRCQCHSGYISANASTDGSHYCEPICVQRCHELAHCSAPDVCECKSGYASTVQDPFNCLPQCTSGCPNGSCLLPEVCKCNLGFEPIAGVCQPICQLGDGCRHGHCIEPNVCVCISGYQMNVNSQSCEKIKCPAGEGWDIVVNACVDLESIVTPVTEDIDATTTTAEAWESIVAVVASINASAEEQDVNDKISDTSLSSSSAWEHSTAEPCAAGYIFFHGDCRPELFPSDENDCHFKACTEHAECLKNGSCTCLEGFDWHANGSACISLTTSNANLGRSESDAGNRWLFIALIALGVAAMVVAILFVGFKLMQRQRGRLDVEAKNDLYCEYENKSNYAEVQLVL